MPHNLARRQYMTHRRRALRHHPAINRQHRNRITAIQRVAPNHHRIRSPRPPQPHHRTEPQFLHAPAHTNPALFVRVAHEDLFPIEAHQRHKAPRGVPARLCHNGWHEAAGLAGGDVEQRAAHSRVGERGQRPRTRERRRHEPERAREQVGDDLAAGRVDNDGHIARGGGGHARAAQHHAPRQRQHNARQLHRVAHRHALRQPYLHPLPVPHRHIRSGRVQCC